MDNVKRYGFRWSIAGNGGKSCPNPLYYTVASGQNDTNDGAGFSVDLNVGDPVKMVNDGGVSLALTTEEVLGIITTISPYWDGTRMVFGNKLPNQTTWGTNEERRSYVGIVPATAGTWEIDCDDKVTATTKTAYELLIHLNTEHVVPGIAAQTSADPMLDISLVNTTNTLIWRIVGISRTLENQDFSGSYVKLLVQINVGEEAGFVATAGAVAGL